jgi:hypothetical protein
MKNKTIEILGISLFTVIFMLSWLLPLSVGVSTYEPELASAWFLWAGLNFTVAACGMASLWFFGHRGPTLEYLRYHAGVKLTCWLLRHFHADVKVQRLSDNLRVDRMMELKLFVESEDSKLRRKRDKWMAEAQRLRDEHPALKA